MTEFNRQDIFDRALAHLRQQGRRAMGDIYCMYRAPDGCRCAIGGLIPDERYSADLEQRHAGTDRVVAALGFDPDQLSQSEEDFLLGLQRRLHDDLPDDGFPSALEAAAEKFAAEYGLRFTPLPPAEGGLK